MNLYSARHVFALAIATVACYSMPAECAAQLLGIGDFFGRYESDSTYSRTDRETRGVESTGFQRILLKNRLTLGNRASYIYNPRLVVFSSSVFLTSSRSWFKGDEDSNDSLIFFGYSVSGSVLREKNLSLNFYANRDLASYSGSGNAGQTDVENLGHGFTLSVKHLYIPSRLSFEQDLRDSETRLDGSVVRSKFQRNVIAYEGERGFIDSELKLNYRFTDINDEISPNLSFQSHSGNLYYSLDFGTELNKRWDSSLGFYTVNGSSELISITANESLRIQHSDRLKTRYYYTLGRFDSNGDVSTRHNGGFNLSHKLYENLRTNLDLGGYFESLPGGRQYGSRGGLNFDYTKRLPRNGVLSIGLGGGSEYNASEFRKTERSIFQEIHSVASPFAFAIPLNQPFVIPGSVKVTKIAFGPLPAGCVAPLGPPTPLLEGRDFNILSSAGDITEIDPIPCAGTDPGINPGDRIAVDYRVSVSPSLSTLRTNWGASISADYRWIRPFFLYEQIIGAVLSGRGRPPSEHSAYTLGVEFRYNRQNLSARALGQFRHLTFENTDSDELRADQNLSYRASSDLRLGLTASEVFIRRSHPDETIKALIVRGSLGYRWDSNLYSNVFARVGFRDESRRDSRFETAAGLSINWSYRKIRVLPSVEIYNSQSGNSSLTNFRATLKVQRELF